MIIEIVSIGDELVLGEIADTNAPYISSRMISLGYDVSYHTSVGDNYENFKNILEIALDRADLIICTGGLGPTKDDITREVISGFCNVPLKVDNNTLRRIKAIFRRRNLELSLTNEKQALIPEGAEIISNKWGTAPGFSINYKNKRIMALPGVPGEMKEMFEDYIYPLLEKEKKEESFILTKCLRSFSVAESFLGEKLSDYMERGGNPLVGTKAEAGIITIRIVAKGKMEDEGESLLKKTEKEIREILGSDVIFGEGEENLEDGVAKELWKKDYTLAVAESCSGGLISHKLTNVSGISSSYLEGITSYSNEAKVKVLGVPEELIIKHGAVSKEVAEVMAEGVRKLAGSDFSISTTGIAGPGGGSEEKPVGLVFIGIATPGEVEVHKMNFGGPRKYIKERTANTALFLLRKAIMRFAEEA